MSADKSGIKHSSEVAGGRPVGFRGDGRESERVLLPILPILPLEAAHGRRLVLFDGQTVETAAAGRGWWGAAVGGGGFLRNSKHKRRTRLACERPAGDNQTWGFVLQTGFERSTGGFNGIEKTGRWLSQRNTQDAGALLSFEFVDFVVDG